MSHQRSSFSLLLPFSDTAETGSRTVRWLVMSNSNQPKTTRSQGFLSASMRNQTGKARKPKVSPVTTRCNVSCRVAARPAPTRHHQRADSPADLMADVISQLNLFYRKVLDANLLTQVVRCGWLSPPTDRMLVSSKEKQCKLGNHDSGRESRLSA